jgi:XapX domain-containing protein
MKFYILSAAAGILVGIVYGLLNVRSPAPPVVALLGLLGILVGEQLTAAAKRGLAGQPLTVAWLKGECARQMLGRSISRAASPPKHREAEKSASKST